MPQIKLAAIDHTYQAIPPDAGRVVCGDAVNILSDVPEKTFRCCVTSPPYWGLRDYGIPHQIGAEPRLPD